MVEQTPTPYKELRTFDTATIIVGVVLIIIGIFLGWILGSPSEPKATSTPTSVEERVNPTPEQIIRLQDRQAASTDEPLATNCTWAETPNGFHWTCGPAYVEPTDCNEGFLKVCVRRYGDRTCGCYPDDSEQSE